MRRLLLITAALPAVVLGFFPLLLWVLCGRKLRTHEHVLVFELKPDSWFYRNFYTGWGGTTFGYVIMTMPDPGAKLLTHELVHVEQFEAATVWGFALGWAFGLLGTPWAGLAVWLLSAPIQYVAAGIVALLRGESFYRGNYLEEAAYAIAMENSDKVSCRRTR